MSPILLDTHVAFWSVDGTLKRSAVRVVEKAAEHGALLLSPITAWELGNLFRKKRLREVASPLEFIDTMFALPGITVADFTPMIAAASTVLPGDFHNDPADRMIIATAVAYGAELMTSDRAILEYARRTKHVRCIAC